jgi:hypothetical protein
MKKFLLLAAFATLLASSAVNAHESVSVDFFYDNLDPYGDWAQVGDYGYGWHPRDVDADWSPYSDGYWAFTDGGWTWVSYEDFGYITYHYGRWTHLADEGWYWIPGNEWAPAWVSWRHNDDYVGWAPLPPECGFRADIGISSGVDVEFGIGPSFYSFCRVRDFGSPALRPVIIDRSRNVTFINQTTNITNITVNKANNVIFNGGPNYQTLARKSAKPIQTLRLVQQTDPAAIRTSAANKTFARQQGKQLIVAAPTITAPTTQIAPKRLGRTLPQSKIDKGWAGVANPQVRAQVEQKMKKENRVKPGTAARPVAANDLKVLPHVDPAAQSAARSAATAQSEPANPTKPGVAPNGENVTTAPAKLSKKGKPENAKLKPFNAPNAANTANVAPQTQDNPNAANNEAAPAVQKRQQQRRLEERNAQIQAEQARQQRIRQQQQDVNDVQRPANNEQQQRQDVLQRQRAAQLERQRANQERQKEVQAQQQPQARQQRVEQNQRALAEHANAQRQLQAAQFERQRAAQEQQRRMVAPGQQRQTQVQPRQQVKQQPQPQQQGKEQDEKKKKKHDEEQGR